MFKTFRHLALAATLSLFGNAASAFEFVVSNGLNETSFNPLSSAQTGASYYNYFNYSGHPGFGTQPNTAFFWLHENSNDGELSLAMIFDDVNGAAGSINMDITGLPTGSYIGLSDDGVELQMNGPNAAKGNWRWINCCTDGGVIAGIDNANTWEIDLDVNNYSGLSSFYFLAGDANNPTTVMSLNVGETITISMRDSNAVPLPAPALLLGGGFLLLSLRLKGRLLG